MSFQSDDRIRFELVLSSSQPALLEGLEVWLRLGLLSEAQVRLLCQKYLCCPLPQQQLATQKVPTLTPIVVAPTSRPIVAAVAKETEPSWLRGMLQSLMAELSVRWLLFLGVFMVVVSSGVLAATQWEKFPAFGQYAVLLGYTSIFWVVSFWASKQRNLQLTAQTLQLVTLFLVPVNFWAMDGFRLWGNALEWLTVAIASVILTVITALVLKTQSRNRVSTVLINYLALCYLHWGWRFSLFPLLAVYLGIVGTAILLIWRYKIARVNIQIISEQENNSSSNSRRFQISASTSKIGIVVYAVAVLLVRAIFTNNVEITQLGLAIAICGWLFAWLSWQNPSPLSFSPPFSQLNWEIMGGCLILLGWIFSVGVDPSWQVIAVSGLGLLFFASRFQRFWLQVDLAAILAIEFQAIWLFWRAIPTPIAKQLVATVIQITNAQDHPFALLSVALFPYVISILLLTDWLNRRKKPELAEFGEAIALSFGIILTTISSVNPVLRSLNLLLSTITLVIVNQRRPRTILVYLSHITGILTLLSGIDYLFPNLNQEIWAIILLAFMVPEFLFSNIGEVSLLEVNAKADPKNNLNSLRTWRASAWYIGLSLAGLSYVLFISDLSPNSLWPIFWLVTPLSFTFVASKTQTWRRKLASSLSVAALVITQILTLEIPVIRLVSLGVATGLMLINTRYLQNSIAALITVGFGLSFYGFCLWEGVPGFRSLLLDNWYVAGAIALNSLWLMRYFILKKGSNNNVTSPLQKIYANAADRWAIAIASVELFAITIHSLGVYSGFTFASVSTLIAIILTGIAIIYRNWKQTNNWGIFAIAWVLELLTAEILGFVGRSVINLSVANIALGLTIQLLGDWWRRRVGVAKFPYSLHVVPLLYGILGAALRAGFFTNWSGITSIGISLIAIGVGRRNLEFKPLVYLGLFGISISAYELLSYQLLQASGGAIGDGLIAMAALGTSIMYAYRVLSPWLISYLNISLAEIKIVAHLHWAWSSCLLVYASFNPIKASILVGLGTGIALIRYAIFQGRYNPNRTEAEVWIYLGILQIFGMRLYWMTTPIAQLFSDSLVTWRSAIATVPAAFIYLLPWENWGWPKRPWQIAAFLWPLIMVLETIKIIHPIALLIVAGFYILLSWLNKQIRFTYISAILIDWALWRWFFELNFTHILWYVIPLGLSLLYIAQVDPDFHLPEQRKTRHNLRLLGIGIICLVSLWTEQGTGLTSGILSIGIILAGLALRIRAFLFIGTGTFLINAIVQLVILNDRYSFFKWLIGLIVGIIFIWIAANFETRREQITALVRNWVSELQNWE